MLDVDWRNNSSFASCSQDRTIVVHRLGDPKPVRVWAGHGGDINSIRWEPAGGRTLASASDDGTVRLWGTGSDAPLHLLTGHQSSVSLVRWGSSGGAAVLASCGGGGVRVWDPETGACLHSFEGHGDVVSCAGGARGACCPGAGLALVEGSSGCRGGLWTRAVGGGGRRGSAPHSPSRLTLHPLCSHSPPSCPPPAQNVSVVSWSPEGDYLASGDVAGEIFVWSLRRGEAVRRLRAPGGERMVYDIRWDESGERLAACYQDDPAAGGSHHPALVIELRQQ